MYRDVGKLIRSFGQPGIMEDSYFKLEVTQTVKNKPTLTNKTKSTVTEVVSLGTLNYIAAVPFPEKSTEQSSIAIVYPNNRNQVTESANAVTPKVLTQNVQGDELSPTSDVNVQKRVRRNSFCCSCKKNSLEKPGNLCVQGLAFSVFSPCFIKVFTQMFCF